jgi:hypothetical protein
MLSNLILKNKTIEKTINKKTCKTKKIKLKFDRKKPMRMKTN